ncbi:MAG TPA: hypothetical protein VN428_25525 [Bryobacteraceae bacterium]|nr:hypothetical protein [Bryobacteraceae bacterium]
MLFSLKYAALALALVALPALAKPNLTGEWKLNVSKSEFGPMPAPTSMTEKITHEDPKIVTAVKSSSERGDFEYELKYMIDGSESVNEIRGNPAKSIAKWDGDTLAIVTKASFNGNELTMSDKWNLSEDGKTLTVKRHMASSMGEGDVTYVFEKQ